MLWHHRETGLLELTTDPCRRDHVQMKRVKQEVGKVCAEMNHPARAGGGQVFIAEFNKMLLEQQQHFATAEKVELSQI